MKKNLSLYLLLHSTTTKQPQYKFLINDVEVSCGPEIVQIDRYKSEHRYNINVESLDTIKIIFFGKDANDTKVDANGNITEDLFLIIEKLSIDNFNFLPKLPKISVYCSDTGTIYKTFNYMSFNGTITIKIHKNILYTDWLAGLI